MSVQDETNRELVDPERGRLVRASTVASGKHADEPSALR